MSVKTILNKILGMKEKDTAIVIVSGLPRSGTSLMMQILEAGGMPVVTDNIRKPDDDNPRGYYEFEKVKKIKEDASWLEDCSNKVFKMVSMLLYHLPLDKQYKVIFMRREMKEMLASQKVMLRRLRWKEANVGDEEMAEKFEKHLQNVERWLAMQPNIDVLYVKYNDVIQEPIRHVSDVNLFLGGRLDIERMTQAIDRKLYRQRINVSRLFQDRTSLA